MIKTLIIIIFNLAVCLGIGRATSTNELKDFENQLLYLRTISDSLRKTDVAYYSDLIGQINDQFASLLSEKTSNELMEYPFTNLQKSGVNIINSRDSAVRVFSWNVLGGTQHNYYNIIFYKTNNQVFSFVYKPDDTDVTYNYNSIYVLTDNTKQVNYILSGQNNLSTLVISQQLKAIYFNGEQIVDTSIFDTQDGQSNILTVSCDLRCSDISDTILNFIIFNEKSKTLKIPSVKENCCNSNYKTYTYNGKYFKLQ